MSILQIYTNIGSQFLTSADKCLHVTLYQTNQTKIIKDILNTKTKKIYYYQEHFFHMNTKTCITDIHSACKILISSFSDYTLKKKKKKSPDSPSHIYLTYNTGGSCIDHWMMVRLGELAFPTSCE